MEIKLQELNQLLQMLGLHAESKTVLKNGITCKALEVFDGSNTSQIVYYNEHDA